MSGLKPLKSLGQNFLINKEIVSKIIDLLEIKDDDVILEIGPGTGALTKKLLESGSKIFAVEKDERAFDFLKENFPELKIFNEDILRFDFEKINSDKIKIIGNLPYYITSQILFKIFEISQKVNMAVFTVQKEVADRIVSEPNNKDYGILSLATGLYSESKLNFKIPPSAFYPAPKVNSGVITLKFYDEAKYSEPEKLLKLIKAGFSQRRKKLSNSIKNYVNSRNLSLPNDEIFSDLLNKRAENLSLNDFIYLYEMINFGYVKNDI